MHYFVKVVLIEDGLQVLGLKERSLQALLQEYMGVDQDKSHQLDDWRQRWTENLQTPITRFQPKPCCILHAFSNWFHCHQCAFGIDSAAWINLKLYRPRSLGAYIGSLSLPYLKTQSLNHILSFVDPWLKPCSCMPWQMPTTSHT